MKDLDLTLDYMENARFNYTYGPLITHMEMESPFTRAELLCLSMVYHKFTLKNGPRARFLTLMQLSNILELMFTVTDREINRRIVARISYDPDCTDPKYASDRHCSLASFIRLFSIYFSTDLEQRMQFVFSIYDENDRGFLGREDVVYFVEKFFTGDDEDEIFELRADMIEVLFAKFDVDKDMIITFEEYCDVVRLQPGLMEFLGKVYPTQDQLDSVRLCVNVLS
ncbi:calaxin [Drosophila montana]|uniref:calaxin n=1 Tax=Drosophila montana TaxID=40370 RepID=UPI00313BD45C